MSSSKNVTSTVKKIVYAGSVALASTRGICLLGKKTETAWACKTMGWYKTAAQVREDSIREQESHIRGLIHEAQAQYTEDQVARKALMTGVR